MDATNSKTYAMQDLCGESSVCPRPTSHAGPVAANAGVSGKAMFGSTIREVTTTQPWPVPAPVQPHRGRTAIALSALTALVALAALIVAVVALTRPIASPTYTPTQKAAAQRQLCNRYDLAGHAVHIETAANADPARARVALTNGALILETAAADPALEVKYRDAAHALALAYQTMAAKGSSETADSLAWRQTVDEAVAKDSVMQELCGE